MPLTCPPDMQPAPLAWCSFRSLLASSFLLRSSPHLLRRVLCCFVYVVSFRKACLCKGLGINTAVLHPNHPPATGALLLAENRQGNVRDYPHLEIVAVLVRTFAHLHYRPTFLSIALSETQTYATHQTRTCPNPRKQCPCIFRSLATSLPALARFAATYPSRDANSFGQDKRPG